MSYPAFPKIPRWHREVVLTEKLDGTNGLVCIAGPSTGWPEGRTPPPRFVTLSDSVMVAAGSRKRWLNPDADNFGFAQWVWDNAYDLAGLGPGCHYGEWYGKGINRGYGLSERRFALFNVSKWGDPDQQDMDEVEAQPKCCEVVTVLNRCPASELGSVLPIELFALEVGGSAHVPGFSRPEGIVLYHTAGNNLYKVTLEGDEAKTAEGFVVRQAGAQADIGLDPATNARKAMHEWENRQPRGEFGGEIAGPPAQQFAPVKVAA